MSPIIVYILKSIVCSGILYGYYRVAFYDRANHRWNRFFLLSALAVSLLIPITKIYIPGEVEITGSNAVRLLSVVASDENTFDEMTMARTVSFNWSVLLIIPYATVSFLLLCLLVRSLSRISKLFHSCPKRIVESMRLVMTKEKDAPFSFFGTIYWNERIALDTPAGSRIFEHEREHVRQLHSLDRLFIDLILIMFWINPFLWLMRKELIAVHEFLADEKAVRDNSAYAFSEMVLLTAFPGTDFNIKSTFFNSLINRRLTMLTTFKKSTSLLSKWLLLPLIVVLFAGFSLRKKEVFSKGSSDPFVVMIDAGHGGERAGVISPDGTAEKDLNLSIAKKIKALNVNDRIKIVMTRESDEDVPLRERVAKARNMGVKAFLSIHINNDRPANSGVQVMMTKNETEYAEKSRLLGSLLSRELSKVVKVDGELRKGADKGVWVLDAPEISYPSLLIHCGNLNNQEDMEFIKSDENQEKIARQILSALSQFADGAVQATPTATEILVESGTIGIDVKENKVVKTDFSTLTGASIKNIFPGDELKADGSEALIVDGIYFSDIPAGRKRIALARNSKLIVVSTKNKEPLAGLTN